MINDIYNKSKSTRDSVKLNKSELKIFNALTDNNSIKHNFGLVLKDIRTTSSNTYSEFFKSIIDTLSSIINLSEESLNAYRDVISVDEFNNLDSSIRKYNEDVVNLQTALSTAYSKTVLTKVALDQIEISVEDEDFKAAMSFFKSYMSTPNDAKHSSEKSNHMYNTITALKNVIRNRTEDGFDDMANYINDVMKRFINFGAIDTLIVEVDKLSDRYKDIEDKYNTIKSINTTFKNQLTTLVDVYDKLVKSLNSAINSIDTKISDAINTITSTTNDLSKILITDDERDGLIYKKLFKSEFSNYINTLDKIYYKVIVVIGELNTNKYILITGQERIDKLNDPDNNELYKLNDANIYYTDSYILLTDVEVLDKNTVLKNIIDGNATGNYQHVYDADGNEYRSLMGLIRSGSYKTKNMYIIVNDELILLHDIFIPSRNNALNSKSYKLYKDIINIDEINKDNELVKLDEVYEFNKLLPTTEDNIDDLIKTYEAYNTDLYSNDISVYNSIKNNYKVNYQTNYINEITKDYSEYQLLNLNSILGMNPTDDLITHLKDNYYNNTNLFLPTMSIDEIKTFIIKYYPEQDLSILDDIHFNLLYSLFFNLLDKSISNLSVELLNKYKLNDNNKNIINLDEYLIKLSNYLELFDDTDYRNFLINQVLTSNPTENTNRELKFLKVKYDENIPNEIDNNNILEYEDVISKDNYWKASKEEVLQYDFNILNTKYYSIDVITNNYLITGKLSTFINYLSHIKVNSGELLHFTNTDINGNDPIELIDAIITCSVLANRIHGIKLDVVYEYADTPYVYGLMNVNEDSFTILKDDNTPAIFKTKAGDTEHFYGDCCNVFIGDEIKTGLHVFNVEDVIIDNENKYNSRIKVKELITFSSSNIKFIKSSILLNVSPKGKNQDEIYNIKLDRIKSIIEILSGGLTKDNVLSNFIDIENYKTTLERYMLELKNNYEFRKLYSFYKSMFLISKYNKEIFNNGLGYYNTYMEYLEDNPNYIELIKWINAENIEGFSKLTDSEKKDAYKDKLLNMIESIQLYVNNNMFNDLFLNDDYLSYIKSLMSIVLNHFKSYTVDILNTSTVYKFNNIHDSIIKTTDEFIIKERLEFRDISHNNKAVILKDECTLSFSNNLLNDPELGLMTIDGELMTIDGEYVI